MSQPRNRTRKTLTPLPLPLSLPLLQHDAEVDELKAEVKRQEDKVSLLEQQLKDTNFELDEYIDKLKDVSSLLTIIDNLIFLFFLLSSIVKIVQQFVWEITTSITFLSKVKLDFIPNFLVFANTLFQH